jgi:RNA polymerase sigma factor (sigma-70 family)
LLRAWLIHIRRRAGASRVGEASLNGSQVRSGNRKRPGLFQLRLSESSLCSKYMDELARYRWIAAHILPCEPELRGWLRRRLGALSANDIDDLVQEAFARIWTADFSTIHNGRTYLYATVRHLLAEYARRSRIVPIELLGEIDSLNIISDDPGPDRRVAARQELDRLRVIVAALPVQCRRVFELRKFECLSHRDIAQRMGISEKTVENHLTRALARITEMLAALTPPGESDSAEPSQRRVRDTDRGTD